MVEFLYNAIKCVAGEDINIAAEITDSMKHLNCVKALTILKTTMK